MNQTKLQIKRFSPHQNGKIVGILMAVSSLVYVLPLSLFTYGFFPHVPGQGAFFFFSKYFILILPVLYFLFGYISIVVCSVIYNFLSRFIGGFEFELGE